MGKTIIKFENFEWIDVSQPTQEDLEALTQSINIEINLLEDTLEHGHLPKIEKGENHTFIILRAYTADLSDKVTTIRDMSNKIAFFINEEKLYTIHKYGFTFIKTLQPNYKSSEALMLDIINKMLQSYEDPLDHQSDTMDELEKDIFLKTGNSISIELLYYQKLKARLSKKILLLTQNVLQQLNVKPELNSSLQDLKETTINHLLQYDEVIEDANTILNSYLSVTAQKNNDVMKLLTIFSAFFLPLTFIVGIYGMNFRNMPELEMKYGYYIIMALMILISILIYGWFKRKKIM